ncbi:unnamed protein product [Auanema sp. JU1783]|nr:unnamed protein product [Auanema sp. JU1783]
MIGFWFILYLPSSNMWLRLCLLIGTVAYLTAQPCGGCQGTTGEASDTEQGSTTQGPPNRFNLAGWETDDNGNVFVGDDNAKLYLISVGSYWPFPKDYRKKRSLKDILLKMKQ